MVLSTPSDFVLVPPAAVLRLVVARTSLLADDVLGLRLQSPDGSDLPVWEPGAHIDLLLPSGAVRQYSLCGDPLERSSYDIAVLRVEDGRGGSKEVHATLKTGGVVDVRGPTQHFSLAAEAPHHLLLAGGIGVTPLLAMARQLASEGADWSAVYGGRTLGAMALRHELTRLDPSRVSVQPEDEHGLIDLAAVMSAAPPGTVAYVCGPAPMIGAAAEAADRSASVAELRFERFGSSGDVVLPEPDSNTPFEIELRASERTVVVGAGETTLDAILRVAPGWPSSCREGYCGTCEVVVLGGKPDHRDEVLTDGERADGGVMMPCVSRALTPRLVLDA